MFFRFGCSLIFLLWYSKPACSQSYEFNKLKWDSAPVIHVLTEYQKTEPAVYITDDRLSEFDNPFGEYICIYTHHYIVHINKTDALDQFNKVYVPMANVTSLIRFWVRAISSAGVVTDIPESNIKDIENYEQNGPYKICAVDGLDAGGEMEVFLTYRYNPGLYDSEILQGHFLKLNVNYTISSPSNIIYSCKSYNGISQMTFDSTGNTNHWQFHADSIAGLRDEQYANYDANLARIEYIKELNTDINFSPLFTNSSVSENYFNAVHDYSSSEEKKAIALLNKMDLKNKSKLQQIFMVEDFIKSNFSIQEIDNEYFSDVTNILKTKVANTLGLCSVYDIMLRHLQIETEIVLTCDRTINSFDPSFQTLNNLTQTLIYCPEQKVFIDPSDNYSHYGLISANYIGNQGLFIKTVSIGNYLTGLGLIKLIPENNPAQSVDSITINLLLNPENLSEVQAKVKRVLTGYSAAFQSQYFTLDQETKNQLTTDYLKLMGTDSQLSNVSVTNSSYFQNANHPFQFSADVSVASLIETAGPDKFLLKIGEAIGAQSELYGELNRQNPVYNSFNRGYVRTIQLNIPENFLITNLSSLNMDIQFEKSDTVICYFKSTYELGNNTLLIHVNEFYNQISLPATDYDSFRQVINAAADFNKLKLVFEPKN